MSNPKLLLIRGIPGSGKSAVANELHQLLRNTSVVLDPDMIDPAQEEYKRYILQLEKDGVDAKFYPYRFLRQQAYETIDENGTVIWNQAFTNRDGFMKTIANLSEYAAARGKHLDVFIAEVDIKPNLAWERLEKRRHEGGHVVDDVAFKRFVRDYQSFNGDELVATLLDGTILPQDNAQKLLHLLEH